MSCESMFTRSKSASTHNAQYNGSTTPSRSDSIKDPAPETACGTQQQRSRSSVSASAHGQVQHDQMRPTAASLPRGLGMPSPALPRASTRSSAFMSGPNGFGVLGSGNRPAQSTQSRHANSPLTSPLFASPLTLGAEPMSLHVRAVSSQSKPLAVAAPLKGSVVCNKGFKGTKLQHCIPSSSIKRQ